MPSWHVPGRNFIVTHDKDFGELAFRFKLPATYGIILLRLSGSNRKADNARVLEALESRTDWVGHFSVVSDDRIRVRPLPFPQACENVTR